MRLVPYLHAALVRYHREGLPPFRALVMDYPDDPHDLDGGRPFLVGESLLVAPVFAGQSSRESYFASRGLVRFLERQAIRRQAAGARGAASGTDPDLRAGGSILALAEPTSHTDAPESLRLSAHVYGESPRPAVLYDDDGSWNPSLTEVTMTWNAANKSGAVKRSGGGGRARYEVVRWSEEGRA